MQRERERRTLQRACEQGEQMGMEVSLEDLHANPMHQEDQSSDPQVLPKRTLLIPYIPGLSDRLKMVSRRYDVTSWFSYRGCISDGFAKFKDLVPVAKSRYAVYDAHRKEMWHLEDT